MPTPAAWHRYWGKSDVGAVADWHPLAWHSLDVAAVVGALLDGDALLTGRLADLAHLEAASVRRWLPVIAALHDLGKFSRGFQHQLGDLRDAITGQLWPPGRDRPNSWPRHDAVGLELWRSRKLALPDALDVRVGGQRAQGQTTCEFLEPWIAAASGHHGRPVHECRPLAELLDEADQAAVAAWIAEIIVVLRPGHLDWPVGLGPDLLKPSSWLVAGIVTLADWLGSDQKHFRYSPHITDMTDYWDMAQSRAGRAVRDAHLLARPPRPSLALADLIDATQPTPLQVAVSQQMLEGGPQLHVIEDLTGAGKTEAAVILAHRLIRQGLGHGIYFALPTMATSNGMFARANTWRMALFDGGPAEFVLAHGQVGRRELLDAGDPSAYGDEKDGDVPAGRVRRSWLADSRKKALLAQLGVGTIDQALLGVLKVKHSTLRQLGVARNILVIDEVHAFDSYTGRLIEVLLELQAMHGGSAIVLSATLTQKLRQTLVDAFWRGRQAAELPAPQVIVRGPAARREAVAPEAPRSASQAYPLWTTVNQRNLCEFAVEASPARQRRLPVRFLHDVSAAVAAIQAAAASGHCIVWIRNTVDDALNSWQSLRDLGVDATIFHARMMAGDRACVEARALAAFGKVSGPYRARRVLVATQVVEQSLDLDFDVMVTDLAPADRIIQRAGRLHRHKRDRAGQVHEGEDARPAPELLVLAPAWADEPAANWLKALLPGAEAVYRDPALLWRTMRVLRERGAIDLPQDARHLVELALSGEDEPAAFQSRAGKAEGEALANAGMAQLNQIQPPSGYFSADALTQWHEDVEMPTRLGDPTERLRLACAEGDRLVPLCATWLPGADWFDADVQVRKRDLPAPSAAQQAQIERAKADMPDQGRWTTTMVLAQDADGTWRGQGIEYRPDAGLRFAGAGRKT